MERAKHEYLNWISNIDVGKLEKADIHLLNLITNNFSDIFESTTYKGNRSKLLISLLENNHTKHNDDKLIIEKTTSSHNSINRISYISIGPFRGFESERSFKFGSSFTLIYGPNGTGKSSLCEGIELSLLGFIDEADKKRIAKEKYIKNTKTKSGSQPVTYYLDNITKKHNPITPSFNDFQYCIIDKNRIDSFSRMSANTTKDQESLILQLFGLGEFNDFVNAFTDNFDKYLDYKNEKKDIFIEKIKRIRNLNNQRFKHKSTILLKNSEVKELKEKYSIENIEDIKLLLEGDNNKVINGLIKQIEDSIKPIDVGYIEHIPKKRNISIDEKEYKTLLTELTSLENEILSFSTKVHYQSIYQSLKSIKESGESIDECPACETPLNKVVKDPLDNAEIELSKLDNLGKLQSSQSIIKTNIKTKLSDYLSYQNAINTQLDKLKLYRIDFQNEKNISAFLQGDFISKDLESLNINYKNIFKLYIKSRVLTKRSNTKFNDNTIFNIELKARVKEAYDNLTLIKTVNGIIEQEEKHIKTINKNISIEKELLSKLKKDAILEKENNQRLKSWGVAYDRVVKSIKAYRAKLPLSLAKGLNEKTTYYYNLINIDDPAHYKAKEINLPSTPNENITIIFDDGSSIQEDALLVLSEGHIKCLGLAILLAKTDLENVPFIIFDDIVNAVDDDHRTAIRALLTEEPSISKKQTIISCHGHDFMSKLQQALPSSVSSDEVISYTFLNNKDSRSIYVSDEDSFKNHIADAQSKIENGNINDSLAKLRRSLESLNNKIWKKLSKKYDFKPSVQLDSPSGEPNLNSVCHAFVKELSRLDKLGIQNKKFTELEKLISSLFSDWKYFNHGTHEFDQGYEFEIPIVKKLINTLKEIEKIAFDPNAL